MVSESAREKELFGAHPLRLSSSSSSYDPIINAIGDAQVVLIGSGSHGTYEFYAHRANIEEKGFTAIAVEADWPDAFRINRYIHGGALSGGTKIKNARDSLAGFERSDMSKVPGWMWKNEVMPPFIDYLKQHNERILKETKNPSKTVSFYGMDLYSLHRSAQQVLEYLERVDPGGGQGGSETAPAIPPMSKMCDRLSPRGYRNLKNLLVNRHKIIEHQLGKDAKAHPHEEQFVAEMNALVVKDAEEYYRTMMTEDVLSWNLRDEHFARTVAGVAQFLAPSDSGPGRAKIVVWAHNSHIGDARATDMGRRRGEISIGQRCREIFGDDKVFNIGFLTNRGTGSLLNAHGMSPPIDGSIEAIFDKWADMDTFIITHEIVTDDKGGTKKVKVSEELSEIWRDDHQRPPLHPIGLLCADKLLLSVQVSLCLFLLSCLVSDGDDDDANSDFPPPPVRTLLVVLPRVAGTPQNVTLHLDSPLVSFSSGWRVATFNQTGLDSEFAFANGHNEEVQVLLPQQTTAVFYQGFTITGGALYFACIDCNSTADVGVDIISVDAHDSRENGTQPPATLFSFIDLDPTRQHVLTVVNLEDDRFNNTSQLTFESVIVQIGSSASSSSDGTVGPSPTQSPGASTLVTVGGSVAQTSTGAANSTPSSSADSGGSASGVTANPTTGGGATQTSGGSSTGTQPPNSSQANQPGSGSSTSPIGSTGTSVNGGGASSSGGAIRPQPSASIIVPSSAPNAGGTSGASNNGQPSTTGVSKPVIIAIAVVASLLVLGLLGAVLFMLLRNQAARRAASADAEGALGLMREAAPAAMVSARPLSFAPMRPQNPFADIVPPNVPLDASRPAESFVELEESVASEYSMPIEEPRPPAPCHPTEESLEGSVQQELTLAQSYTAKLVPLHSFLTLRTLVT
ncbi:hypothetical protein ONZ51_g2030 [Trametes cubensis]|uniref:Erythromycin esterase n=1 Tax=Trametes cubensis TaxID=1111947 RepID=A0AAD7XCF0_9APHY|nr:hypothetical protein ONZ51_g2030 [Trametes cubensis]